MNRRFVLPLFIFSLLLACSGNPTSVTYVEEPVVQCVLIVGKGIEEFRFTRTLPVEMAYDSTKAAIPNATIRIYDDAGKEIFLRPVSGRPGVYHAPEFTIEPRHTYFLEAEFNGTLVKAQTTTPDTFSLFPLSQEEYVYLHDDIRIDWRAAEGASAYYFTVTNIDSHPKKINRRFSEQNPYAQRKTRFFWTKSTGSFIFSWLHNYFGTHIVKVYAIDENLFLYLQSFAQQAQELNEPQFLVENGLGYFGSASLQSCRYILKQP